MRIRRTAEKTTRRSAGPVCRALVAVAIGAAARADSIQLELGETGGKKVTVLATVEPKESKVEWSLDPAAGTLTGDESGGNGVVQAVYTPAADPAPGLRVSGEVRVCAKIRGSQPEKKDCVTVSLPGGGEGGGPVEHVIVGLEQAGASAAQSTQRFFFDFLVSRPWGEAKDSQLGPRFRTWGNMRLTSVPQQISTPVAEFVATGLARQTGELKVNEVAQGAEFLVGIDYRILEQRRSLPSVGNERTRTSLSLIASFGAITPIYPRDGIDVYAAPPQNSDALGRLLAQYGDRLPPAAQFPTAGADGKPAGGSVAHIAFVPQDRERFFRQYWGGLRLQSHHAGKTRPRPANRLDLTTGRNENLTGGRFRGVVGRMEAFYALPFAERYLYLIGSAQLRLQRDSGTQEALLLNRPAGSVDLTEPSTKLLSIPANSRDSWKIAIGIDFVRALRSWIDAGKRK